MPEKVAEAVHASWNCAGGDGEGRVEAGKWCPPATLGTIQPAPPASATNFVP